MQYGLKKFGIDTKIRPARACGTRWKKEEYITVIVIYKKKISDVYISRSNENYVIAFDTIMFKH